METLSKEKALQVLANGGNLMFRAVHEQWKIFHKPDKTMWGIFSKDHFEFSENTEEFMEHYNRYLQTESSEHSEELVLAYRHAFYEGKNSQMRSTLSAARKTSPNESGNYHR